MLTQLYEKYPDDIRIVFRNFPLPGHTLSIPASVAAEAAGKQGKFWEMKERIFASQGEWATMSVDQFNAWLVEQAGLLELDTTQFKADQENQEILDKVKIDQETALQIGIPGTPFVLLNGLRYDGGRDLGTLESILKLFQLEERLFTYCPPMLVKSDRQYTATIETEKGEIVIQLLPENAPLAVNSFVFLARNGWFNDTTFHRVIPGLAAQTGDPSGSGIGGPGYTFADEITDLTFDNAGLVAMANAGPNLNGSQFFITLGPEHQLDGKYTIFGTVIKGMDIVLKLQQRDPQTATQPGDKIITITVEEK